MTNNFLEPDNHALLPIDHQDLQIPTLRSHEASQVIGNVVTLGGFGRILRRQLR